MHCYFFHCLSNDILDALHITIMQERDSYVDFLRGFGLLLIVIAHTFAPETIKSIRTFDVPLMVFISAICFKPLRGGLLAYLFKRLKRIYIPVIIFLSIFFTVMCIPYFLFGKPEFSLEKIIGSFLLLNSPSIGYVWIMRVFLLMAISIPLLFSLTKKISFISFIFLIFLLLFLQNLLVENMRVVDTTYGLAVIYNQFLLYLTGYSLFAVLALKIKELSRWQVSLILILSGIGVAYFSFANSAFNPGNFKYPPQVFYLVYGIFGCTFVWIIRPLVSKYTNLNCFKYLSKHSMWLYLWHIIPVYFIPLLNFKHFWLGRYIIVLFAMIMINEIWRIAIGFLPEKYRAILQ